DLGQRSGSRQNGGGVPVDAGGGAAAQGATVLSAARGERGNRIHRVCLRAEPAGRYLRRAGASSAGCGDIRVRRQRPRPPAQFIAQLKYIMPGLVLGIHVFLLCYTNKTWMAGDKPGHEESETGTAHHRKGAPK